MHSAKAALRKEVLSRRRSRSDLELADAARGFNAQLGSLVAASNAKRIVGFLPISTEPPIAHIMEKIALAGVDVLVPVSQPDSTLEWVRFVPGEKLGIDHAGMPSSIGAHVDADTVESADIIVIPAAAIDSTGIRLGWGKGYYDRFLATFNGKGPILAVVFDDEVIASVPREAHDVPVNGVVTPTRTIWF